MNDAERKKLELLQKRNTAAWLVLNVHTDEKTVNEMLAIALTSQQARKEKQRRQTPKQ
jgi:hypothetical protein